MSVKVTLTVAVEHSGESLTMEVDRREPGDNPLYTPSQVRAAIATLAEKVDTAATLQFGDIGEERAEGAYFRKLPTRRELTT
jgi:hypothetical protein